MIVKMIVQMMIILKKKYEFNELLCKLFKTFSVWNPKGREEAINKLVSMFYSEEKTLENAWLIDQLCTVDRESIDYIIIYGVG